MNQVSWRIRLAFGVGQLPEGIKSAAFGFFLLFYYNQVLGLSGTLSGIAIFIAMLVDAVSDPMVGALSDSTRSRWGRRHPYMYASAIPFALSFYFLFVPMDGLSEMGLFWWLTIFSILTRTCMTFYSVPHMSLGAELTSDYDERTLLSSLRMVLQLVGQPFITLPGKHGNKLHWLELASLLVCWATMWSGRFFFRQDAEDGELTVLTTFPRSLLPNVV